MTKEEILETIEGLYGTIKHHKEIGVALIKENGKLKKILNEIKEYCNNPLNWKYTDHYLEKEDILEIIERGNGK